MAFTIQYNTPTEVQTGPIRVIIDFTNDEDNSSLYVSNVNSSDFELINEAGETIPSSTYTLEICTLAKLNNRQLNISFFSGSGSFRIKTSANASLIGSRNPYPTNTSSGNISLNDPQTSRAVIYRIPPTDTSSTPSSTPEPLDPEDQVPEPDPESGPEQTQFLAAVEIGLGSGSVEDSGELGGSKEHLELVVGISHLTPSLAEFLFDPDTLSRSGELTICYTWMTRLAILTPVSWGGPSRVWALGQGDPTVEAVSDFLLGNTDEVESTRIGRLPKVYNVSPMGIPSAFFTQKVRISSQSKGTLRILINPNTASGIVEIDGEEVTVVGPLSPVIHDINYDFLIDDVIGPTVKIIFPPRAVLQEVSMRVDFHWSEPIRPTSFKLSGIIVTAKNINNEDVSIGKKSLVQLDGDGDKFEMIIFFPQENLTREDAVGVLTVRVKAKAANDFQGQAGPPEPVEKSANYDLDLVPPGTEIQSGDGTAAELVCSESFPWESNPFLDKINEGLPDGEHTGGGFKGVSDLIAIEKSNKVYLYGVMQVATLGFGYDKPNLHSTLSGSAGGALFQVDTSKDRDCTKVIKAYQYFVSAARSLVEYDNKLFFYEGSHYSQIFPRGLIGIQSNKEYDWRHKIGKLGAFVPGDSNIDEIDPTIDYGRVWKLPGHAEFTGEGSHDEKLYEESIMLYHKATSAPMRTLKNDLYLYSGTGNLDSINDYPVASETEQRESNISAALDNWILLRYSNRLDYRLPNLDTNQKKGYQVLTDLAQITGSYVGAYGRKIFYLPKFPIKAKLENCLRSGATILKYKERSRPFPNSGLVLVEDKNKKQEIIEYQGKENLQLIGISPGRGKYGTKENSFNVEDDTEIYYVNYVLDMDANFFIRPINEMNYRTDFNQLYNQFRLRYGSQYPPVNEEYLEYYKENKVSVNLNGGKELELDIAALDERHNEWVEWLADFYINFYSNLHYITNLTLVSSFHFKLGDVVLLRESALSQMIKYRKLQVINISQNKENNTTNLQLRTL